MITEDCSIVVVGIRQVSILDVEGVLCVCARAHACVLVCVCVCVSACGAQCFVSYCFHLMVRISLIPKL